MTSIQFVINLDPADLLELLQGIFTKSRIEGKLDQILTLQESIRMQLQDFQAKIDQINANTSASAAAAGAVSQKLTDLKNELDTVLTDAGIPAADEEKILAQLTAAADTSGALKTFLEGVAAGPTEPAPVPVPDPAPVSEG